MPVILVVAGVAGALVAVVYVRTRRKGRPG